jgi:hypothetical protein
MAQGTQVTTNTYLNVASGTTYVETHSLAPASGGSVNNSGTIILNGDLMNQNSSQSNLGPGTFQFTGTTLQTISGPNLMTNVLVNNSAGLSIAGNTEIDGVLTLTSGLVTLGSNNLLLGPSATISGTPSATNMIVATGSGQLQKNFTGAGSFTFPVGDAGPHYSPVTLNFISATFGGGAYAGVNLVNAKYPDANITGDYLNRYWTVSATGITNYNCNAVFYYTLSDVVGTEGNIYCLDIAPPPVITYSVANTGNHSLTATGLINFGSFTGGHGALQTAFTAFLQGPYNSGAMNTNLKTLGLIPLTQPYSGAPWNYSGTESVSSIPAGVVDWILIDLRQASTPAGATSGTSVAKRAAFLKSDGTIVDLDGVSSVRFYNTTLTSNLYPVLKHRNHLAIMSNNAVTRTSGIYSYDFTSAQTQIYDGSGNGCVQLGSKWGMVAGDGDASGIININDFNLWQSNFSQNNYNKSDHDLSGTVNINDFIIWQNSFAKQTKVPN